MMTKDEIFEEIEKLTTVEKLELIEYIAQSVRQELEQDKENKTKC